MSERKSRLSDDPQPSDKIIVKVDKHIRLYFEIFSVNKLLVIRNTINSLFGRVTL